MGESCLSDLLCSWFLSFAASLSLYLSSSTCAMRHSRRFGDWSPVLAAKDYRNGYDIVVNCVNNANNCERPRKSRVMCGSFLPLVFILFYLRLVLCSSFSIYILSWVRVPSPYPSSALFSHFHPFYIQRWCEVSRSNTPDLSFRCRVII